MGIKGQLFLILWSVLYCLKKWNITKFLHICGKEEHLTLMDIFLSEDVQKILAGKTILFQGRFVCLCIFKECNFI